MAAMAWSLAWHKVVGNSTPSGPIVRRESVMTLGRVLTFLVASSMMLAGDITGAWKLNLEKSILRNPIQSYVVKITLTPPNTYRCVFDIVNAQGERLHAEVIRIADGREHPVRGVNAPVGDVEVVSPGLAKVVHTREGRLVYQFNVTFSPDGRECYVHQTGTNAVGKPYTGLLVFDRQ